MSSEAIEKTVRVLSVEKLRQSFDGAQDERMGFEIIGDFVSVHAEALEAFRTFFQQPGSPG